MAINETQSIHRAIDILDSFSERQPEVGVREIARKLNLHPSTVGRILMTLTSLEILTQDKITHRYKMGSKVLKWGAVYMGNLDLQSEARPYMEELRQKTNETVSLYVPSGNERVLIERLDSTHFIRIVAHVGQRMPLYAGASGKVFLSFLASDRREEVLENMRIEPLTSRTIIDPKQLRKELDVIRKCGYAVCHGERVEGASSVSAPIFNFRNQVIGAISISGPTSRFSKEKVNEIFGPLVAATSQISRAMGNASKELG
jgi:IclR family transcriptional regulator, KDG regulon repressor